MGVEEVRPEFGLESPSSSAVGAGTPRIPDALIAALEATRLHSSRKALSIVIPAYNEAERIGDTVLSYATAFQDLPHEIVVELDGCSDGTSERVRAVQKDFPSVRLVEFSKRLGKGRGVLEGMLRATGDWIAYLDADGSVPPAEFSQVAAVALSDGWDAVIASRYWNRARIVQSYGFARWVASRTFNRLVRLMYGLPYEDTQCGAKIFRRAAIEAVIGDMKLSDYAFDVELLWRLWKAGFKIKEMPIVWRYKDGSKIRIPWVAPRMLLDVVRLRVNP